MDNCLDFEIIDDKILFVSPSGVHLWLILSKAYDAVRQHAERHIHSLGLGLSDFAALEALLHKGPLPVNSIGTLIRLTSGSITAAIDRLELKGLVERRNDPGDRRARVVFLTPAGKELISQAFSGHAAAMDAATAGLSAPERETAIELLRKLGLTAQAKLEHLG